MGAGEGDTLMHTMIVNLIPQKINIISINDTTNKRKIIINKNFIIYAKRNLAIMMMKNISSRSLCN